MNYISVKRLKKIAGGQCHLLLSDKISPAPSRGCGWRHQHAAACVGGPGGCPGVSSVLHGFLVLSAGHMGHLKAR